MRVALIIIFMGDRVMDVMWVGDLLFGMKGKTTILRRDVGGDI
jgi:hypothetical protein